MVYKNLAGFLQQERSFLIHLVTKSTITSQLSQIHAQIIVAGLHSDLIVVTKLAQKLTDLNAMDHASYLSSSFPKPDLFLYNVLLRGYSHDKDPSSAIVLYHHVRRRTKLVPDNFTYAFAMSALSSGDFDWKHGLLLHAHLISNGFQSDVFVGSTVVDFYMKFSQVESARKVFDAASDRDTVLWNTMISGLVRNCCFDEAVRVFQNKFMEGRGFDSTTLAAVLPAVAELQDLSLGMAIQCLALKAGLHLHAYILTGLVSLYAKCGEIDIAWALFGEIEQPDLISYNAMISGYTCNNEIEASVKLFRQLLVSGEKANSSTIVGLIPVYYPFSHLVLTQSIHGLSLKSGIASNPSVSTALITVYSRLNEIKLAQFFFDESAEKSLASWNAMISGYTQNGLTEMAISLFQKMQVCEVSPSPVTVTSILSACAQLGALSLGKWVHNLSKRNGYQSNIYVSTALIDMYAKCGSIMEARQLFDIMPEKNVVTWNAMISGYGLHGYGNEALGLYHEMLHLGVQPTGVTLLSVLYACSHAGLVREGNEIFHSMIRAHGLKPSTEHYTCMVDIFGRAGQLDEALDFIQKMPIEPSAAEWGALLGACMVHKDTNLARIASEKLFDLDPQNVGYYVLLSNIYSTGRNYPEAASVRQIANRRKLEKTPGCTLIEVAEMPHVFTSGDLSHPQTTAIYAMLEKLMGKMKEAGFQIETLGVLHDVEDEEKELMVNVHSEKLAIAFGLISSEPGTEIRIIKNLRICVDCHSATKFISKITNRVIVARDVNRFHHFKDGVCSCGDYW